MGATEGTASSAVGGVSFPSGPCNSHWLIQAALYRPPSATTARQTAFQFRLSRLNPAPAAAATAGRMCQKRNSRTPENSPFIGSGAQASVHLPPSSCDAERTRSESDLDSSSSFALPRCLNLKGTSQETRKSTSRLNTSVVPVERPVPLCPSLRHLEPRIHVARPGLKTFTMGMYVARPARASGKIVRN